MPRVEWSRRVERAFFRLPARSQAELLAVVALLRQHSEMFQLETQGRYRGLRRALIRPHWLLYYRVIGPNRDCLLVTVRDARRRPV